MSAPIAEGRKSDPDETWQVVRLTDPGLQLASRALSPDTDGFVTGVLPGAPHWENNTPGANVCMVNECV